MSVANVPQPFANRPVRDEMSVGISVREISIREGLPEGVREGLPDYAGEACPPCQSGFREHGKIKRTRGFSLKTWSDEPQANLNLAAKSTRAKKCQQNLATLRVHFPRPPSTFPPTDWLRRKVKLSS